MKDGTGFLWYLNRSSGVFSRSVDASFIRGADGADPFPLLP